MIGRSIDLPLSMPTCRGARERDRARGGLGWAEVREIRERREKMWGCQVFFLKKVKPNLAKIRKQREFKWNFGKLEVTVATILEIECEKSCWNGQGILFPRFQRCSNCNSKRQEK
jgi:hypothetical protein